MQLDILADQTAGAPVFDLGRCGSHSAMLVNKERIDGEPPTFAPWATVYPQILGDILTQGRL